jgi:hypothetical protein
MMERPDGGGPPAGRRRERDAGAAVRLRAPAQRTRRVRSGHWAVGFWGEAVGFQRILVRSGGVARPLRILGPSGGVPTDSGAKRWGCKAASDSGAKRSGSDRMRQAFDTEPKARPDGASRSGFSPASLEFRVSPVSLSDFSSSESCQRVSHRVSGCELASRRIGRDGANGPAGWGLRFRVLPATFRVVLSGSLSLSIRRTGRDGAKGPPGPRAT